MLVADANLCFKIPQTSVNDAHSESEMEAACTLGVGWISAAQALKQRLYKDDKAPSSLSSNSKDDTVSEPFQYSFYFS